MVVYEKTVQKDGTVIYWKDKKIHRLDGPAIIHSDGTLEYVQNNLLHRKDGPAIVYPDSKSEWWLDGEYQSGL